MQKYKHFETEKLLEIYKDTEKRKKLAEFNSAALRKTLEMQMCFIKAELIRRNITI